MNSSFSIPHRQLSLTPGSGIPGLGIVLIVCATCVMAYCLEPGYLGSYVRPSLSSWEKLRFLHLKMEVIVPTATRYAKD